MLLTTMEIVINAASNEKRNKLLRKIVKKFINGNLACAAKSKPGKKNIWSVTWKQVGKPETKVETVKKTAIFVDKNPAKVIPLPKTKVPFVDDNPTRFTKIKMHEKELVSNPARYTKIKKYGK